MECARSHGALWELLLEQAWLHTRMRVSSASQLLSPAPVHWGACDRKVHSDSPLDLPALPVLLGKGRGNVCVWGAVVSGQLHVVYFGVTYSL